ncbi:MAG TPA: ATP-binding protein, partial [Ktedonobacterales bacterium]|nr:ATP-binding protein [Ktedonobacterales bacterium]
MTVLDIAPENAQSLIVTHTIVLTKQAGRQLDERKSAVHIDAIAKAALTTERVKRGWTIDGYENPQFSVVGDGTRGYTYSVPLTITCTPTRLRSTIASEFENLVATADAKAQLPAFRWRVALVDGEPYIARDVESVQVDGDEELGYAPFELPSFEAWKSKFDGVLYGMEDYIEIIYRALELAVKSNWRDRVNIALIGPPACGKSHLCKIIASMLGQEAVFELDATSTTMAGAQKELGEREEMPRVIILEEVEKAPEASLPWLLSVLDLRGEIKKTTARKNIDKTVKLIGICTINDEQKFANIASGALASRFALPLYFERAKRDVLWSILNREVRHLDGDEAWIEPALDFAEALNAKSQTALTVDPRKLIAICL